MVVRPRFLNRLFGRAERLCFVLMPYRAAWSERVWTHIKKVATTAGMICERAKELKGDVILEDIWTGINQAEVILAEVTGRNPNVMYEVGIAHTIGKRVVFLVQNEEDIIFDLKGRRHVLYEDNVDGFDRIARELPSLLGGYGGV